MQLWKTGEVVKVNEYLDARALRQNKMFHRLLQALIELAPHASEERSVLESISNHVVARGVAPVRPSGSTRPPATATPSIRFDDSTLCTIAARLKVFRNSGDWRA